MLMVVVVVAIAGLLCEPCVALAFDDVLFDVFVFESTIFSKFVQLYIYIYYNIFYCVFYLK